MSSMIRSRCPLRTRSGGARRASTVVSVVVGTLVANGMVAAPAPAALARGYTPPQPAPVPAVAVKRVPARVPPPTAASPASALPAPAWPRGGTAELDLTTPARSTSTRLVSGERVAGWPAVAGGLSVVVAASRTTVGKPRADTPARVRVEVLDQAAAARAGLAGVLLRLGSDHAAGTATVSLAVDYGAFATAYGGDWSNRLRLVRLPECALAASTATAACAGSALPTRNDAAHKQVTAEVPIEAGAPGTLGTTLLAVTAGVSGPTGSFAATTLSPSSTWSSGGSSGGFAWSYPMRTPPAVGGPTPTVELSYSSQAVDGRMAASNNQPSVVGEGFELATGGYIERGYKSCGNDRENGANNATKTGDECWVTDNATLSLSGHSVELIRDNTNPDRWYPRDNDGSRVERRTGASNGDDNGEWWVVTTPAGTQYWFGRNHLPGWSPGRATTKSVWTVPVFGNHSGEPCHAATFAASACTQAWRWNLDYVVDPHGNTMSLWYSTDTNYYAKNLNTDSPAQYIRSGQLDRVEYGTRVDPDLSTGSDTVFTGMAAARVLFGYADRCLSECDKHDAAHFPDTPYDLNCGPSTCTNASPSFWTSRRLSTVTTQVRNSAASDFRDVERWTLTHSFPDPGDSTRAGLWLSKISRAGLVGTTTTLPDVVLTGAPMDNRVDAVDNAPAMRWSRLVGIRTETGGLVQVDYSDPDCVAGSRAPSAPENNTLRCYPVKWTPEGFDKPQTDYFHKYVVENVTEADLTGGAPRVVYHYTYHGAPAWHYADDDGLLPDEAKTWSQWRGYSRVTTTIGDPGEQTSSESLYFRGMNGDKLPSGTRSVTITDSQGGTVADEDWFAGMVREQRTFNGPGGAEVTAVINDPWASAPAATRTIKRHHGGGSVCRYARHPYPCRPGRRPPTAAQHHQQDVRRLRDGDPGRRHRRRVGERGRAVQHDHLRAAEHHGVAGFVPAADADLRCQLRRGGRRWADRRGRYRRCPDQLRQPRVGGGSHKG